jgi:hypothetical protein
MFGYWNSVNKFITCMRFIVGGMLDNINSKTTEHENI